MIEQHPHDDVLLELAAGSLAPGPALVVATHVGQCGACRARVRMLETLGGVLLGDLAPVGLQAPALADSLQRIDAATAAREEVVALAPGHPPLPPGMAWPQTLQDCRATPWRWLGPGMRWSRLHLPADPAANLVLLRIAAGRTLARHTHSGREFTQVLHGSFHDGRARFGAGDFDEADEQVHHLPAVQAEGECICLAWVEGRLRFDGALARMLGALVGL